MPVKNQFIGQPELKRLSPYGGITAGKRGYGHASKWKGEKNYVTPFGMGH